MGAPSSGSGSPASLPHLGLVLNAGGGVRSVEHPAYLPAFSLLGGASPAPGTGVGAPGFLPAFTLLGGASPIVAVENVVPYDQGIPAGWYADIGYTASYVWHQLGTSVPARDSRPTVSMSITADNAVFAGTATADQPPTLQDILDAMAALATQMTTMQTEMARLRRQANSLTGGGGGGGSAAKSSATDANNAAVLAFAGGLIGGNQGNQGTP
jgi:hypothetical protein